MKQEDWKQQLRERMDTWHEPVPDELWNRIERRIGEDMTNVGDCDSSPYENVVPPVGVSVVRRKARLHRFVAVAASLAVMLVVGTGYFYRRAGHVRYTTADNSVPVRSSRLPVTVEAISDGAVHDAGQRNPSVALSGKSVPHTRPGLSNVPTDSAGPLTVADGGQTAVVSYDNSESGQLSSFEDTVDVSPKESRHLSVPQNSSTGDILLAQSNYRSHKVGSRKLKAHGLHHFTIGLTASGNLAGNEVSSEPMLMASAVMRAPGSAVMSPVVGATPLASAPSSGSPVGTEYSEPMYLYECSSTTEHKLPVSFGMLVGYRIGRRFSLESGITYTYLRTDFTQQAGRHRTVDIQRLHYVGIPLQATLDMVRLRPLTLYCSMGAAADFCVSATMSTASHRRAIQRDRVQFSLHASLGIRCAIGSGFNLFGEFGEHYAVDNGNMMINYFDGNKHYGVLQMGIKYEL